MMRLIGLIGMGLVSCTSEEETPQSAPVELTSCVTRFEEEVAKTRATEGEAYGAYETYGTYGAQTRAWTLPTGYSRYEDDKFISVFFTQGTEAPEEEFFFKSSGKWRVSKTDLAAETYYLYGYVPHESYVDASIVKPSGDGKTFADGAVLTLSNLNAIMNSDLCVMVGAKNGVNDYKPAADYEITGLKRGDFAYAARTTGESGTGGNYVFLLFDHMYAAFSVNMKVDPRYDALRTIKLKELHLQTATADGAMKNKTTATITLTKTDDGSDPISDITFAPTVGDEDEDADCIMFESKEGVTLETSYISGMPYGCYFLAQDVNTLILTSVYDIYDKDGNLVRKGCEVTNTMPLHELLTEQETTRRGFRYLINMTIKPTYLYVLSDPDLNNPTVTIN